MPENPKKTSTIHEFKAKAIPFLNSRKSWMILFAAWAFYLYEYMLRASPGVMTEQLMGHFEITAGALGALSSYYYLAYAPLQMPCGMIVDSIGPRKVITVSALLCVIGTFIFATADTLWIAKIGRFLIGAGSACAYLSCMKIASVWFDQSKFALIAGAGVMLGSFGGMLGNSPLANAVNAYGWQKTMFYAAILGGAIALISWLVIRDNPNGTQQKQTRKTSILSDLKTIATNKQNILIALYGCFTNLVINVFAELWGVPFLMAVHNINNEVASQGTTAVFIGFAMGCLLSGIIVEQIKSHIKIMSLSALSIIIGFGSVFWIPMPFNLTITILFFTGILAGMQVLYFTAASRNSPKNAAGTTIGFINTFVVLGALLFQPILGYVLEFFWDGSVKESGIANYSVSAYQNALSVILVCAFAAFIVTFFIQETYPKKKESFAE